MTFSSSDKHITPERDGHPQKSVLNLFDFTLPIQQSFASIRLKGYLYFCISSTQGCLLKKLLIANQPHPRLIRPMVMDDSLIHGKDRPLPVIQDLFSFFRIGLASSESLHEIWWLKP